jgi:hypothetical protein
LKPTARTSKPSVVRLRITQKTTSIPIAMKKPMCRPWRAGMPQKTGSWAPGNDVGGDRNVERDVLRRLERAALLEDVDAEVVGDPVEHDRRDHLVGPDSGLQEPGDPRPDRPGRGCDRDPEQDVGGPRHVHERDADPVRADQADDVLAVAADVEQAAPEGERDGEAAQESASSSAAASG